MIAAARVAPLPHLEHTDPIGLPNAYVPMPMSAPSAIEAPPPPGSGAVSWAPETAGADWGEMPTSAEIEAREAAARRAAADARLQTQLLEEQLAARRLQGELASAQQCHAIEQAELSERVRSPLISFNYPGLHLITLDYPRSCRSGCATSLD